MADTAESNASEESSFEDMLQPLLKSMFPFVADQAIVEAIAASGGDGDMAINILMTAEEEPDFDPSIDAPFLSEVPSSPTVVGPYGEHGGRCGYCHKSATGRISWGMTARRVRIDDYEVMQDQGWTRSGTWMYHPSNDKACCAQYVIRLDVNKFVPSKHQKHVLAKVERFLSDVNNTPANFQYNSSSATTNNSTSKKADDINNSNTNEEAEQEERTCDVVVDDGGGNNSDDNADDGDDELVRAAAVEEQRREMLADVVRRAVQRSVEAGELPPLGPELHNVHHNQLVEVTPATTGAATQPRRQPVRGDYACNVAFKLQALYSRQSKNESDEKSESEECQESSGQKTDEKKRTTKKMTKREKNERKRADERRAAEIARTVLGHIEQLLSHDDDELRTRIAHCFGGVVRASAVGAWLNFFTPTASSSSSPSSSSSNSTTTATTSPTAPQTTTEEANVGGSTDTSSGSGGSSGAAVVPHRWEMEIRPAEFTEESYQLYRKYIIQIHNKEESTERSYNDFLCVTPLFDETKDENNNEGEDEAVWPPTGYGSFHQEYRLDGQLIAVGVLDVLHSCLTSVYFFYDPDYAFLSLGVYSALQEIAWVQRLSHVLPRFHHYYMAYYIYDCPKMNYKANYRPSDLMCPFYREWVPLESCLPRFRASGGRFTALVERDEPPPKAERLPIDRVPIRYDGCLVGFNQIRGRLRAKLKPLVDQWCSLVSPDIAARVVLSFRG